MEILLELQQKWNIDLFIVAIVLLSGFFQEKYLCKIYLSKDSKFDKALKTLIVSFIASLAYVYLQYDGEKQQWAKYFISYFFATSLYELLVKPVARYFDKLNSEKQ